MACRSCGKEIDWVVTIRGKAMPLDPEPADEGGNIRYTGNVGIVTKTGASAPEVEYIGNDYEPATEDPETWEPLFKSHFATCPNAELHRQR